MFELPDMNKLKQALSVVNFLETAVHLLVFGILSLAAVYFDVAVWVYAAIGIIVTTSLICNWIFGDWYS